MGVYEVLRGGRKGYYIGLMGRIGLIWLIRQIVNAFRADSALRLIVF